MEKVSIIVPLYNKEKYIKKCLTSLVEQTYENIEIIVIDDGSTDKSSKIIQEEFVSQIRYYQQKNAGVAVARNYGLALATGQYIIFVDADDYLEVDYVEKMMLNKQYDIAISGYVSQRENVKKDNIMESIVLENGIMDYIFRKDKFPYFTQPWGKLFKKEIIDKINLEFPNLSFGEDTAFVLLYLTECSTMSVLANVGYINVENMGTLSRKRVSNMEEQLDYLTTLVVNKGLLDTTYRCSFWYLRNIKLNLLNVCDNFTDFTRLCKSIRKNEFNKITFVGLVDKRDKILYLMLKYRLYLPMYSIIRRMKS